MAHQAKGGLSLEDAIGNLPKLLSEKQADLERREEALKKAEEAFATERKKVYGDTKPSDVLELNVGGTYCTVLRSTLCQWEGSMLASRFSGRWDDSLEKDKNGRFIIDQSMEFFAILLKYLRSHANESEAAATIIPPTFQTKDDEAHFKRMVQYYGCADLVYSPSASPSFRIIQIRGNEHTTSISHDADTYTVKAKKLSTFTLEGPNSSKIKSFEVVLDNARKAMIGWTTFAVAETKIGNGYIWSNSATADGASMAIDVASQVIVGQGSELNVADYYHGCVSLAKGSIIRCELDQSAWYFNGDFVCNEQHARRNRNMNSIYYLPQNQVVGRAPESLRIPAFACQGEIRVQNVLF